MSITLGQILALVGKLDDSPGDDSPRERFRRYLEESVEEIGQIRDYVEECLRNRGDQYNRSLQDLVNHIGGFLGFDVAFGRYRGIRDQIGFDGHWKSPTGFSIVVEVKTSETYPMKTARLVGYVDDLISQREISSWDKALGLYIVGRPDPDIRQLENSILAEKRTNQLRIISVESLLSLAEMMNEYDVSHDDVMAVLRPSGPTIDLVVELMARLVAQPKEPREEEEITPEPGMEAAYWLTPVKSEEEETAEQVIQTLVGDEMIYAFGERTPGRRSLKTGDWICFYASGRGVVAFAKVSSIPEEKPHPKVRHSEKYPWVFNLESSQLFLEHPVVLDASLRSQLDAFQGRDPSKPWAWFVQATRSISRNDFRMLTNQSTSSAAV